MKQKQANLELLRILAMFMVITLHYLGKGDTLLPMGEGFGGNAAAAWIIEAFCIVAVNVYVLISGYFLIESPFKIERIVKLWLQVLFYSFLIAIIFIMLGRFPEEFRNPYYYFMFFFPTVSTHYWFATSYVMLYLLYPFLNAGLKKMSKKQLQACIVVLLLLFSGLCNTLFPMSDYYNDKGYGILWFVCLYVIGSYIRLHGVKTGRKGKYLGFYVLFSLLIAGSFFLISVIYNKTGKLGEHTDQMYDYNSLLALAGAVALFLLFLNIEIKGKRIVNVILRISGLTFGVYLIHEHLLLRGLWDDLWQVGKYFSTPFFLLHCLVAVLLVYVVCLVLEQLRQWLFALLYRTRLYRFIIKKLSRIDMLVCGEGALNKER